MYPTCVGSDFTVDGGDYRNGNSLCKSPSGSNAVRDGLFSASFVISLLIFMFWLGYYPAYLMYKKCCSKPEKPDGYVILQLFLMPVIIMVC